MILIIFILLILVGAAMAGWTAWKTYQLAQLTEQKGLFLNMSMVKISVMAEKFFWLFVLGIVPILPESFASSLVYQVGATAVYGLATIPLGVSLMWWKRQAETRTLNLWQTVGQVGGLLIILSLLVVGGVAVVNSLIPPVPFAYTDGVGELQNSSVCNDEVLFVRVVGHSQNLMGQSNVHRYIYDEVNNAIALPVLERPYGAGGTPLDFDFWLEVDLTDMPLLPIGMYRYEHIVETTVGQPGETAEVVLNGFTADFEIVDCGV